MVGRVFMKGVNGSAAKFGLPLLILLALAPCASAQQARPFSGSLLYAPPPRQQQQSQSKQSEEEEEFIKPARPTVATSAEIQKPGVLQVESGYDSNFRSEEFRAEQTLPLTLRFAASKRVLLEADLDVLKSETDEEGARMTGVGDTRLGFQLVALEDTEEHPALAFAYYVKLPSASREKGLGTGRVDHRLVGLLSKKFGETDMDLNVAYLNVGREDSGRRASGGQAALAFSREFENHYGFEAEVSGQSLDDAQPRGVYALGALTYKVNRRLRLDGGARFGLNPEAPRVGVFAGMSVGVADFFKK